jgi:hypothetical protein
MRVNVSLIHFGAGIAGGSAACVLAFRTLDALPSLQASQIIFTGLLLAICLTIVRTINPAVGVVLCVIFALGRLGLLELNGSVQMFSMLFTDLVLGLGAMLIAVIFHLLAESGLKLGKFLLVGPLVGGLFVATTMINEFFSPRPGDPLIAILIGVFLGAVVGNGVSLGVELVELHPAYRNPRRARQEVDLGPTE